MTTARAVEWVWSSAGTAIVKKLRRL